MSLPLRVEVSLRIDGESYGTVSAAIQYRDLQGLAPVFEHLRHAVQGALMQETRRGFFRRSTETPIGEVLGDGTAGNYDDSN